MVCRFLVCWPYTKAAPTEEKIQLLRGFLHDDNAISIKDAYTYYDAVREIYAEHDDVFALEAAGFEVTLKRFSQNRFVSIGQQIKNTYGTSIHELREAPGPVTTIHIPNVGLLAIDEVQLLGDSCTDTLQRELNEGWRILAVCPPNGQRRPDYILGRTKTEDQKRRLL